MKGSKGTGHYCHCMQFLHLYNMSLVPTDNIGDYYPSQMLYTIATTVCNLFPYKIFQCKKNVLLKIYEQLDIYAVKNIVLNQCIWIVLLCIHVAVLPQYNGRDYVSSGY